jgi:hypothetical protein
MISAAFVTAQNWNEPGYTSILVMDESGEAVELDSFELDSFVDGASISTNHNSEYLKLISDYEEYVNLEYLENDEIEDGSTENELIFVADEELLERFGEAKVREAISESLANLDFSSKAFLQEIREFALAAIA